MAQHLKAMEKMMERANIPPSVIPFWAMALMWLRRLDAIAWRNLNAMLLMMSITQLLRTQAANRPHFLRHQ